MPSGSHFQGKVNAVSLPPLLALQPTAGEAALILACSGIEGGHVSSRRRGSPLRLQGVGMVKGTRPTGLFHPSTSQGRILQHSAQVIFRAVCPILRCVQVCMWVSAWCMWVALCVLGNSLNAPCNSLEFRLIKAPSQYPPSHLPPPTQPHTPACPQYTMCWHPAFRERPPQASVWLPLTNRTASCPPSLVSSCIPRWSVSLMEE